MKYYLLKKKLYFPYSFRCIMKITIPAIRSRLWETLNLSKCADSRGQKNQHYWSKKRRRKNVLPITWHISPVSYTNNHHRLSPANFCSMHGRLFFLHILKQPKWVLDCNFSNTLTVHSPCCSGRGWRGQGRQTDIATCSLNNISILKNAFYMHGTCSCQNIIEDILESFSSSFYNFSTAKDFSNRSYKVFLLTLAMGLTS